MNPTHFTQANTRYGPPADLEETQCQTIHAFKGTIQGGSLDGCGIVVTAWQPDARELEDIKAGKPVYLCVVGGLPPHLIDTSFDRVIHPM